MINIISTCANKTEGRGPYKVFSNLTKGLDKIGYPYVINRAVSATKRLWIHDDVAALRYMHHSKASKIVGPNLFVMPGDIPDGIRFDGALYVQPCDWAKKLWENAGFTACPIKVWPAGIDAEKFRPRLNRKVQQQVVVYHKHRDTAELTVILETLHELKLRYSVVIFGQYSEREYLDLLQGAILVIWHGGSESQGVALQEAMACDVPGLICDATNLSQNRSSYYFGGSSLKLQVTSAPYFDESCGIKITDLRRLKPAVEFMLDNLSVFAPRQYVLQHLSLEKQARAFVDLWGHWDLTFEEGVSEGA